MRVGGFLRDGWRDPRFGEQAKDIGRATGKFLRGRQNERQRSQVGQPYGCAGGQRPIGRKHRHQLGPLGHQHFAILDLVECAGQEGDVDVASQQSRHLLRRGLLIQAHQNIGMGLGKTGKRIGQEPVERGPDKANAHFLMRLANAANQLGRKFHLSKCGPRLAQQHRTGIGQLHPAPRTDEQGHAKIGLQPADGLAEWRLGNPQGLGRAAKVQYFGHRNKVAHMPQVDGHC